MKWFLASLVLLTPAAYAQDAIQIVHFQQGRYEEAAYSSTHSQSPDYLAFTARALLAKGMCGSSQPPNALLSEAEMYARNALALEPNHVEARLQLAIALSLKARPMTIRAAIDSGYGDEAKSLVDAALKLDPQNPYAHGFMAVWNIEVVRRGGAIGSRIMGASVSKARHHYAKASALSPGDASLHWQYARALAALNPRKYRREIDTALSLASRATVDDHLERIMMARAAELLSRLQTEPRKTVRNWARDML